MKALTAQPTLSYIILAALISQGMALNTAQAADAAGRIVRDLEVKPLALPQPSPALPAALQSPKQRSKSPQSPAKAPRVRINKLVFEGNNAFDSATLAALIDNLTEQPVSFAQLQQAANTITAFYRQHGWLLAQAVIPAQKIDQGQVTFNIIEGHYGKITLTNHSPVSDRVLKRAISSINEGDAIKGARLENALMQANAIPGAKVQASLAAGHKPGSSDLSLNASSTPKVTGNLVLDNYGNTYNGAYRLGGGVTIASPAGIGDELAVQALVSNESQLWLRGQYNLPVGPWNTRLGLTASWLQYELGKEFKDLNAKGNANSVSLFASQSWWRQRSFSVNSKLELQQRKLSDEQLGLPNNKSLTSLIITPVSGYWRDNLLGGSANSYQVSWTVGQLSLDSNDAKATDFFNTEGRYNKLSFALLRQQTLTSQMFLQLNVRGQLADNNLDSVEKFSLGGAYGVRAYPQGEASGDEGWLANIELRRYLGADWQIGAFIDAGGVTFNKNPTTPQDNSRHLSGAGLAAYWQPSKAWQLTASAAVPTSDEKPQSDKEKSVYVWAQLQFLY